MDQLISRVDPLGRKTQYCWCTCGGIARLTDPANNITAWTCDLEGRATQQVYADGTATNYVYQPTTSLLQSSKDALNQVTAYAYNLDNSRQVTTYSNAVNATSQVTEAYDTVFPRVTSTTNGWGSSTNSYNPYVSNGSNTAYIWIGGNPEIPNPTDTINITFFNSALSSR